MTRSPTPGPAVEPNAATPWWRVRFMWLVVGGPLAVVVAALATLWLAAREPDPLVGPAMPRAAAGASSPAGRPRIRRLPRR